MRRVKPVHIDRICQAALTAIRDARVDATTAPDEVYKVACDMLGTAPQYRRSAFAQRLGFDCVREYLRATMTVSSIRSKLHASATR